MIVENLLTAVKNKDRIALTYAMHDVNEEHKAELQTWVRAILTKQSVSMQGVANSIPKVWLLRAEKYLTSVSDVPTSVRVAALVMMGAV